MLEPHFILKKRGHKLVCENDVYMCICTMMNLDICLASGPRLSPFLGGFIRRYCRANQGVRAQAAQSKSLVTLSVQFATS